MANRVRRRSLPAVCWVRASSEPTGAFRCSTCAYGRRFVQLHEQLPHIEPEAPELRDLAVRTVETTGYQLAERVFAEDGGHEYRKLRAALVRLAATRACVRVVERDPELAAELVREGYVSLVGDIWLATTRLNLRSARERGALRANLAQGRDRSLASAANRRWTLYVVDLDLLRALGSASQRARGSRSRDGRAGHSGRLTAARSARWTRPAGSPIARRRRLRAAAGGPGHP